MNAKQVKCWQYILLVLVALLPVVTYSRPVVHVTVVGGLQLSGFWPRLKAEAEQALDMDIVTVSAAPKKGIVPDFISGRASLMIVHGGDETHALQGLGYAAPLRTVAYNEHVIVGPADDPARLDGIQGGAAAIVQLQQAHQPVVVGFRHPGSNSVMQRLLKQAGLVQGDLYLLHNMSPTPQQILTYARTQRAYTVVGHISVAFNKTPSAGMRVLVQGDPAMRRAYVIATPGPQHPAGKAERQNAERLADYLLSPAGQLAVRQAGSSGNKSWVFGRDQGPMQAPLTGFNRPSLQ
ncbi:MAG: substrate-binding domain-containing protein [Parahaliea sp.]